MPTQSINSITKPKKSGGRGGGRGGRGGGRGGRGGRGGGGRGGRGKNKEWGFKFVNEVTGEQALEAERLEENIKLLNPTALGRSNSSTNMNRRVSTYKRPVVPYNYLDTSTNTNSNSVRKIAKEVFFIILTKMSVPFALVNQELEVDNAVQLWQDKATYISTELDRHIMDNVTSTEPTLVDYLDKYSYYCAMLVSLLENHNVSLYKTILSTSKKEDIFQLIKNASTKNIVPEKLDKYMKIFAVMILKDIIIRRDPYSNIPTKSRYNPYSFDYDVLLVRSIINDDGNNHILKKDDTTSNVVKGTCTVCGEKVYDDQERFRDDTGNYTHESCNTEVDPIDETISAMDELGMNPCIVVQCATCGKECSGNNKVVTMKMINRKKKQVSYCDYKCLQDADDF